MFTSWMCSVRAGDGHLSGGGSGGGAGAGAADDELGPAVRVLLPGKQAAMTRADVAATVNGLRVPNPPRKQTLTHLCPQAQLAFPAGCLCAHACDVTVFRQDTYPHIASEIDHSVLVLPRTVEAQGLQWSYLHRRGSGSPG